MILEHCSTDVFYRSPLGALGTGAQVRLRVALRGAQDIQCVELRTWDGAEHRYPMRPLGLREGRFFYEAQISVPQTACLLWYRF